MESNKSRSIDGQEEDQTKKTTSTTGEGRGDPEVKRQKLDDTNNDIRGSNDPTIEGEDLASRDEIVSLYVKNLGPLPSRNKSLPNLSQLEIKELENVLEFDQDDQFREDWIGNLHYADKEVKNPSYKSSKQPFRQSLLEWSKKSSINTRLVWNLVRYVCKYPRAKRRILAIPPHMACYCRKNRDVNHVGKKINTSAYLHLTQ